MLGLQDITASPRQRITLLPVNMRLITASCGTQIPDKGYVFPAVEKQNKTKAKTVPSLSILPSQGVNFETSQCLYWEQRNHQIVPSRKTT